MTDIVQMISGCDGKRFGAAYAECVFIFISVSVVKEQLTNTSISASGKILSFPRYCVAPCQLHRYVSALTTGKIVGIVPGFVFVGKPSCHFTVRQIYGFRTDIAFRNYCDTCIEDGMEVVTETV